MSKFARMIDTLDLYSESDALLTAEEVAARLQVSRPTAFRYLRELTEAGLLANFSGRYSLGARIITLDLRMRQSDPVLKAARDPMQRLSAETGCTSVLCRMYNDEVINVFEQAGYDSSGVSFGRGHALPLFRGAGSKAMLAHLPLPRLRRICERHAADADLLRLGRDWPAWRKYFDAIRQRGYYMSDQELEAGTVGLAAPVLVPQVGVVGVIGLVFGAERLPLINVDGFAAIVRARAGEVAQQLAAMGAGRGLNEVIEDGQPDAEVAETTQKSRKDS